MMKKSILNIGHVLNKTEQKQINGSGGACALGSSIYFQSGTSNCCAYPSSTGGVCYGTVTNNFCTLGPRCS